MKKIITFILLVFCQFIIAQDTLTAKFFNLDEVTVTSIYRNSTNEMAEFTADKIQQLNVGQEPSYVFKSMPSIYSRSDNGTEFGYGYFYIRGLDQTRVNATLDGMPWNEAEDFGVYFANSPDIMSSMHTIKVERGASAKNNGIAACAGNISLESVDLKKDTTSNVNLVYGSFNTYKASVTYNMGLKNGFGLHIRATQSGTDGYRDHSFNQSHALTAKLGYYFNDRQKIDFLSLNSFHKNGQGWIGGTLIDINNNIKYNGNTKEETDNWIQSVNKLQYTGWLSDNTLLTASAYLQYQTGSYRMDLDNYMHKVYCDNAFNYNLLYDYALTHYMYGGNIALKSKLNIVSLSGGINVYGYQRQHYSGSKASEGTEKYNNIGYKVDVEPFINIDIDVYKGLTIGANFQYRYVNFKYKDIENPCGNIDTTFYNYSFFNGGMHINYVFNKSNNIYANLGVTNREATRSSMFGGNEYYVEACYDPMQPELVHDLEVGYNANYNKINANVNLFYMYFTNELIVDGTTGFNGLPSHINADKSYRTGIEITTDWNIIEGLHWINNISYSINKFNKDSLINYTQPYSPSWTINEDIVDSWKYKNVIFALGLNFNFRDKMFIDIFNKHSLDYSLALNAYGNINIYNICEIGLRINNITNKIDNYCYGSVNANNELMVVQEAGINVLGTVKFFF